jgi:D-lactate dehydrogenase
MSHTVTFFSTKPYDVTSFTRHNEAYGHTLRFLEHRLDADTAQLASGSEAVCAFVNDQLNEATLTILHDVGVKLIALRSAVFNHVHLPTAHRLGLLIARVPAYSPHAVAEHTAGIILSLNRKLHRAYSRVREANFSLQGLTGFDLYGRTVGVIGAGKIGMCFARIMVGFGCRVLLYDPFPSQEALDSGLELVTLERCFQESHIISLHCPLTPQTHHIINEDTLATMRDGVMIINTGRGALLDTRAVIEALKRKKVGYLGLDVYEEEEALFFSDLSDTIIQDDVFMRLLTFPNVLITAHQAFLTDEALGNIAQTTLENVSAGLSGDLARVALVPTAP